MVRPLEPEKSVNYAVGAVLEKGSLILTADYFRIDLSDRLAVTQDFTLTPAEVDQLLQAGVENARGLASFRFFTNEISTTTQGIDLVFSYAPPRLNGNTTFSAVFNHTTTEVTQFNPELLNVGRRVRELQEALPQEPLELQRQPEDGPIGGAGAAQLLWRLVRLGTAPRPSSAASPSSMSRLRCPSPRGQGWRWAPRMPSTPFPTSRPMPPAWEKQYSEYTPWGFNGGYYYLRLSYSWKTSS